MKSINLTYSHKELQFQIFACFTMALQYAIRKGFFITFESAKESFVWKIYKSATAPEKGDAEVLHSYSVNKGVYQMNDIRLGIMSRYLEDQAWKFFKEVPDTIILQRSTMENILDPVNMKSDEDDNSALHFTNFHSMDEHPETGEDGYSDDVLIDLDGWRKDFRIGYYDKDNGWEVYQHYLDGESTKLDLKHGKWTYLPINKGKKVDEPQPSSGDVTHAVNSIMSHFNKKDT